MLRLARKTLAILFIAALPLFSRADLWSGASGDVHGWKHVDWLGWFWSEDEGSGWIYTVDLGWMYALGESQDEIYFWASDVGWLFSGYHAFPSFYNFGNDSWYYYNVAGIAAYPMRWWSFREGLWLTRERVAFGLNPVAYDPEDAILKKSIVLIRHGERMPELVFPQGPQWPDFLIAQLTLVGSLEEYNLGTLFRERLVTHTGLLPSSFDASTVHIVSSDATRCVQSAEAFLEGLYGSEESTHIHVDEAVFSEKVNAEVQQIIAALEQTPGWQALQAQLDDQYAGRWAKASGFESVQLFSASGADQVVVYDVGDTLMFEWIKGYPLPLGFETPDVDASWAFFNQVSHLVFSNETLGRIVAAPMLDAVARALEGKTPDGEATDAVFFLLSGHDGNFWPLMGALGIPLDENPHFASFLEFSVYELAGGEEVVGISYNGQAQDLTAIWGHPGPCPLEQFLDFLNTKP